MDVFFGPFYHAWTPCYEATKPKKGESQLIHKNYILQFIPTTCIHEIDMNLEWEDLSYFHVLIISSTKLKFYALEPKLSQM